MMSPQHDESRDRKFETGRASSHSLQNLVYGFLIRKLENDSKNVQAWRKLTLVASASGMVLFFFGATSAIVVGLAVGLVTGSLVGGISTLASISSRFLLQSVHHPAEKAKEEEKGTYTMIVEEWRRKEYLKMLGKLDKEDQKEYLKQQLAGPNSELEEVK